MALTKITRSGITADAIDGTKIADDAINSEHLTDGGVDTAHIGANQVTAAKVASDVATQSELDTVSTVASAALPKAGGAMTGAITTNSTFDGIDIATRDGVLTSTTATAAAALPKAGGAMTGAITTNSTFDGVDIATRDAILTSTTTTAGAALPKAGGTMTGDIAHAGNFTINTDGNIALDNGSNNIVLLKDGAQYGLLTASSGNLVIKSGATTAITFANAAATFASTIVAAGNITSNGNLVTTNDVIFGANANGLAEEDGTIVRYKNTHSGGVLHLMTHDGNEDIEINPSGWMRFETAGSERMRITDNGTIGIGNTIPNTFNSQANLLVVGTGSGDNGITIYSGSGTGDSGNLFFADGAGASDETRGGISYQHETNQMQFRVNDANKMEITSAGNVGIGTNSPSNTLVVNSSGGAVVDILRDSNSGYLRLSTDGTLGTIKNGGGALTFKTGGDTERMRILSDGKVGIGTTTPGAPLNVRSTADGTIQRFSRSGVCDWDFSIGNTPVLTGVGAGAFEIIPQNANMQFCIGKAGTTTANFVIASNGQIGLGGANYGTDGQVLTSTGASTTPAWEDAAGGSDVHADGWTCRMNGVTEVSEATIDWGNVTQIGSNNSESGGVITIGTAGWYFVMFRVFHYSTDTCDVDVSIRNGTTDQISRVSWDSNRVDKAGTGFALVDCAASDTVSIFGSGKFQGAATLNSNSYFMGFRLGDT